MRINYPERIHDRVEALVALERQLRRQPTSARVQRLRLLKSGAATSWPACMPLVGYSLTQLKRWWAAYQLGGLAIWSTYKTPPGRRSLLTAEAWVGLQGEWRAGHLARLENVRRYLHEPWHIDDQSLDGVWWLLKRHRVKLQTGRRRHRRADAAQQAAFKKTSAPG